MTPDPTNVREFVEIFVAQARAATKDIEPPGVLQMCLIHPASEGITSLYRYDLGDQKLVDRLTADAINASENGLNSYIEGRTVRAGLGGKERGGLADTRCVFALVIDSDADKNAAWQPSVPVSLSVETSPGNAHHWLFFERAIDADTGKVMGERLRAATGADADTGNIAQPYRLAGTVNYPGKKKSERGRVITPTRLLNFDPDTLWTPERFDQEFPAAKSKANGTGTSNQTNNAGTQKTDADVPPETMAALLSTEKGGRGQVLWNVVQTLQEDGWTVPDIVGLLERYPEGIAQKFRGRLERAVTQAWNKLNERNPQSSRAAAPPLTYIDIAREPIPAREWAVLNRIPARNVTLLSGEGAIGKTILLLQLSAAHVLGRDWIGTLPEPGAVIYLSCEDDDDEMCRRLEAIAAAYQVTRSELASNGLRIVSMVGKNALLGVADRKGLVQRTDLFEQLYTEAVSIRPKAVILDTAADVFGGDEISRAQTRQFLTLLRSLAIASGAAVILSAHPSLTGISTDTGLSGSTAWHNSVRARLYFKPEPDLKDPELRVLEVKKNNYGPVAEEILLRWRNGVFVPEPRTGSLEQMAADRKVEDLFLTLLRRFTKQGRNVSDKPSSSYAPSQFENEPEAKEAKATKKLLAAAMTRLFAANKIRVVIEGSVSRPRGRLVEGPAETSNDPSNDLPTLSNDGGDTPSYNLPSVGRSNGPLEGVGSPNGPDLPTDKARDDRPRPAPRVSTAADAIYRVIGPEPDGTPCDYCGLSDGVVYLIRNQARGVRSYPLHEQCAEPFIAQQPGADLARMVGGVNPKNGKNGCLFFRWAQTWR
jgi:RecA-family ATPase